MHAAINVATRAPLRWAHRLQGLVPRSRQEKQVQSLLKRIQYRLGYSLKGKPRIEVRRMRHRNRNQNRGGPKASVCCPLAMTSLAGTVIDT